MSKVIQMFRIYCLLSESDFDFGLLLGLDRLFSTGRFIGLHLSTKAFGTPSCRVSSQSKPFSSGPDLPWRREFLRPEISNFNTRSNLIALAEYRGSQLKPDHHSPADAAGRFRTTRWSVVLLSAQSNAPGAEAALAELCRLYWYPIYAFVRYYGHAPHDAQDLTQSFFLHLLEHKVLTCVDPLKGKFRSFLLASVQNFLSDEADRARRKKRGGDREFVRMDAESAEERYRFEPVDYLTAETIFDARWAMTVLGEAMRRLRREYAAGEKTSTLETLEPFLDPINNRELPSYEQAANELQISLSAVKTLIHRLRKQYTGLLRQEVGRTVSDPGEIDDEIHGLCGALVASEGRLNP